MTDYVKSTNFTSKDSLPTGNPLKIVKGAEIDTEFNNIAIAVASKADINSPSFTGTPTAPTATVGTSSTQVATTAFVQTASTLAVPTGIIFPYAASAAPGGYLICDGSAVSRTTYASLYAVVGTTYGSGDGSTTFNLPNFKDRMPIGVGNLYNLGNTGGSKDAIVVSHTHTATVTDPGHSHTVSNVTQGGGFDAASGGNNSSGVNGSVGTSTATTGISVGISTTGSSGTNANLPPYIGINFIIKT